MAGLGHVALGLAVGRLRCRGLPRLQTFGRMAFYAALAMLPDADVIGFPLGVRYESTFGHRGAVHSLVFAALVGLAIGAVQTLRRRPALAVAVISAAVVASHGLLDALTDGGLGVALLWPFSTERIFFSWRPIAVSPIGPAVFSPRGLRVALSELLIFSPLWLFALWPRRGREKKNATPG